MITENSENLYITAQILIFLSDFIAFFYILLKVYTILCFSKITFDQLPILNPYKWPFSFFRIATKPYFKFWSKTLPNLRLGKISYDVSAILGLQVLSSSLYLCLQLRTFTFVEAQKIISQLT